MAEKKGSKKSIAEQDKSTILANLTDAARKPKGGADDGDSATEPQEDD